MYATISVLGSSATEHPVYSRSDGLTYAGKTYSRFRRLSRDVVDLALVDSVDFLLVWEIRRPMPQFSQLTSKWPLSSSDKVSGSPYCRLAFFGGALFPYPVMVIFSLLGVLYQPLPKPHSVGRTRYTPSPALNMYPMSNPRSKAWWE